MSHHYSDPSRENDPHALPDVEVCFGRVCLYCGAFGETGPECSCATEHAGMVAIKAGWIYAFGFPGCLWDSDPVGPFETEAEALEAAREA